MLDKIGTRCASRELLAGQRWLESIGIHMMTQTNHNLMIVEHMNTIHLTFSIGMFVVFVVFFLSVFSSFDSLLYTNKITINAAMNDYVISVSACESFDICRMKRSEYLSSSVWLWMCRVTERRRRGHSKPTWQISEMCSRSEYVLVSGLYKWNQIANSNAAELLKEDKQWAESLLCVCVAITCFFSYHFKINDCCDK